MTTKQSDERTLRVSRAVAVASAVVYYIEKDDFLKLCPEESLTQLENSKRSMNLEDIVSKISRQFMLKKLMNKALLDATDTNAHDYVGNRHEPLCHLVPIKRMTKLTPWLEKARGNKTKNKALLHEIKKVQLLWTKEEKMQQQMGPDSSSVLD